MCYVDLCCVFDELDELGVVVWNDVVFGLGVV